MTEALQLIHVEQVSNSRVPWAQGKDFLISVGPGKAEDLRLRAAFTPKQPVFARLPFSYQSIPPKLRSLAASFLGSRIRQRQDQWAIFPRWPLDLSADYLSDLEGEEIPFVFFDQPTPVILSHDLDSAEGLENLVKLFLPLEEKFAARSTNYIVPFGEPINHRLLEEVYKRGCEIGIHGYDHSNRTPFCSKQERKRRLESCKNLIERYQMIGYRAPSLLRTRELLHDLAGYFSYDSSIPTSGGPFPAPNNGCASARPFLIGNLMELPLSLPRDGSLMFLGHSPHEILKIWIECTLKISESGGVVVLLTHCEKRFSGNAPMLKIYEQFLEYISSSENFVWSRPVELLKV